MSRKSSWSIILLAVFIAASLIVNACAKPQPAVTLRVHSWSPNTHMQVKAWEELFALVTEETDGRVQFQHFYSASIVASREQLDGLDAGLFDIGPNAASFDPSKTPLHMVTWLPLVLSENLVDIVRGSADLEELPAMEEELARWNVKHVFPVSLAGVRMLISTKPVYTVEDVKGLKVRALGGIGQAFANAGANPISIPAAEAYDALQKGTIDAVEGYLATLTAYGYGEVAKYVTTLKVGAAPLQMLISVDAWNKLGTGDQETIIDLAKTEWPNILDKWAEIDMAKYYNEDFPKHGVTVIEFPKEEQEKWDQNFAMPVAEEWIKDEEAKGRPGREIFNAWVDIMKKYTK